MAGQKRVLLLCGDYVEDYEVMVPFQALLAYGLSVDAVCPGKKAGDICRTAIHDSLGHQTYSESRGHNFALNATFDEVEAAKYDGLVIPGGRAPEYLAMNGSVIDLVKKFEDLRKPIASICHGQLILAAAGSVKGRKCTAYPAVKPALIAAGAHWVEPETMAFCTSDGNLITGATYEGHPEFIRLLSRHWEPRYLVLASEFCSYVGVVINVIFIGLHKQYSKTLHHLRSCNFLLGVFFLLTRWMYASIDTVPYSAFLADYMEDYEVMVPFQSLQALECHVDAICPGKKTGDLCPTAVHDFEGDQTYSEKPGHKFTLTADFESVDASSYEGLVIPGGRAPEYLALNEKVIQLVKEFMESAKPVASICHGQQILSAAGVLKETRNKFLWAFSAHS
ncbi:protein DJ-1D [Sesamum angolense]|uniref:Protein DJ-1D n=1 Tax=Sesamum angolense TaxID=2727404 RepID=A0AAE1XCS1_9LAMI|nr:protein DJ-1D [Sesamum angolense]